MIENDIATVVTDSANEASIIQAAVNNYSVLWYKVMLDNKVSNPIIPNHAFQVREDDRGWTDVRSGETGDILDLDVRYFGGTRIDAANRLIAEGNSFDSGDIAPGSPEIMESVAGHYANPPFPVASLPEVIRNMVEEMKAAEGLSSVLSSMCCISIVSAALGNAIKMNSCNTWSVMGNLYMVACGDSGVGKSKASERASKPLRDFARSYAAEYKQTELPKITSRMSDIRKLDLTKLPPAETSALEKELNALEIKLEMPVLTVMDVTSEKLADSMSKNGGAMAMIGPECRSAVEVIGGRYLGKGNTDETFYLSAYSGDHFNQSRISRGCIEIETPCLTLLWLLQPDKFREILSKSNLTESGLLCRMLLCDSKATSPEDKPSTTFSQVIEAKYADLVKSLLVSYRTSNIRGYTVNLSSPASDVISRYKKHSQQRARVELRHMNTFVSRWAENAYRLTLVFHAALHGREAHLSDVSKETAESAVNVVSWFAFQQVELVGQIASKKEDAQRVKVLEYIRRNPDMTARDIGRGVNLDTNHVAPLVEALVAEGIISRQTRNGVRKSTHVYAIKKQH